MLLAAGRGQRMRELTADVPKPMLEVGAERLIERQLRLLASAGIDEVVINLSYRGAAIRDYLGERTQWGQAIAYSEEGEPPLETAGGIIAALPLLGQERFLVVNADVYADFDFRRLIDADHDNALVLVPNPSHHAGDFGLTESGLITQAPPLLTYAGLSVLSPGLFAGFAPGRLALRTVLDAAIAAAALGGILHDGVWEDVGTPERLERVRRIAARGQA